MTSPRKARSANTSATSADATDTTNAAPVDPVESPRIRSCSHCDREALVCGVGPDGLSHASCEDERHRSAFQRATAVLDPYDLAVTAARAQPNDAEVLAALCAAQSQHPSDLAARAVRLLVERLASSVLVSA